MNHYVKPAVKGMKQFVVVESYVVTWKFSFIQISFYCLKKIKFMISIRETLNVLNNM